MDSFTIKELLWVVLVLHVVNLAIWLNMIISISRMKNELELIYRETVLRGNRPNGTN